MRSVPPTDVRRDLLNPNRPPSAAPRRAGLPRALHWQLLPPQPNQTHKLLVFDLTRPASEISIRDVSVAPHRKLSPQSVSAYLDKPACSGEFEPLTEMRIRCDRFPDWEVTVRRPDGGAVTVRDVFDTLFIQLDVKASIDDKKKWVKREDLPRLVEVYIARCEASTLRIKEAERRRHHRRVDMLLGDHWFLGLRRPPQGDIDSHWVVEFGKRPY